MQKNKIFVSVITALVLGAGTMLLPTSAGMAQDASVAASASPIRLVENAGRAASTYARQNPGVAVVVRLGTHSSTPTPERIREVLTADFQNAGLDGPVTFFFDRHNVEGTAAAFYYAGDVDGPFSLGQSRSEVQQTTKTYNFRKSRGLLEYER